MRGRKPIAKDGNIRPTRFGFPTAPKDLSAGARAEWNRIRAAMKDQLVSQFDVAVMRVYCEDVATYQEACAKLSEMGKIIDSPKGYPIENPWLWIAERAKKGILKAASELGLTPIARTRLSAESPPKQAEQKSSVPVLKIAV